MSVVTRYYPEWKAPAQDGQILIWPDDLPAQTRANQALLSPCDSVRLQKVPLSEIRTTLRKSLQHPDDQPLIITGHQTELYHPGVWAKHALMSAAARKLDAAAWYVAVDTDAPKHLHIRWPGGSIAATDDPRLSSAAWSGLLDSPTSGHLHHIRETFETVAADWNYMPALLDWLNLFRGQCSAAIPLTDAIVNANAAFDRQLGLDYRSMMASQIWLSDAFLLYAHALLADAARFARVYNQSLDNYRERHGLKNAMRPMPDLFTGEESIEAPFWLDDLTSQSRTRPSVFARDGKYILELLNGEEFAFDPAIEGALAVERLRAFLHRSGHRLSPRALTLTLFLRLCLTDNFIHGIGGGRYDQVTDQIIEDYFGIQPPGFAVATATLYLPQALERQRTCLSCLQHEGHQLRHRVLGDRKMEWVRQIDELPRRSMERGLVFSQMQKQLRAAANHPSITQWQHRLEDATTAEEENAVYFDRELFYTTQPRSRLLQLAEAFGKEF